MPNLELAIYQMLKELRYFKRLETIEDWLKNSIAASITFLILIQ